MDSDTELAKVMLGCTPVRHKHAKPVDGKTGIKDLCMHLKQAGLAKVALQQKHMHNKQARSAMAVL